MTAATTQNQTEREAQAPQRLGYRGEVSDVLEQKLTLFNSGVYFSKNWEFKSQQGSWHDVAHGLLSLVSTTRPLLPGHLYNGSEAAEVFAAVIETVTLDLVDKSDDYTDMRRQFVNDVLAMSQGTYLLENEDRVLALLLADANGKMSFDIRKENQFDRDEMIRKAELIGITIIEDDDMTDEAGTVHIVSEKYGRFEIYGEKAKEFEGREVFPFQMFYPRYLTTTEPFVPYRLVTEAEAAAVYDALEPGFQFLQEEFAAARKRLKIDPNISRLVSDCVEEVMNRVTIDQMMDRISKGTIYAGPIRASTLPGLTHTEVRPAA